MSATTPSTDATPESSADENPKAEYLRQYLREQVAAGDRYFKSKFIAEDVELSPKEIGALIVRLQESATELSIEPWSYTGATTWLVQPVKTA
ncbi:DUF7123 family protein [Halohasta salina]|uniref:DUF7123 family protein n=1 Tax=Halohasta salina TaxID=2961621 RepID=UPI0020A56C59|nr:hypothetical protein [Halohasta salina]